MSCKRVVEMLLEYVSKELPDGQHKILEEHFRYCPPCQAYLQSYEATIRMTHELPREAPLPPEMIEKIKKALQQEMGK